ncbi:hypothetical protein [Clostridium chrysemydis]|uniref:hypothetical protein n=1 Tax=Clostridium chrysemydis TaxID=2665504 RepID=UPI0018831E57|nr:hypothetical protein [Clostridium chrysemydis]
MNANEKIQGIIAKSIVAIFMFFQLYLNLIFTDDHAMEVISEDIIVLCFLGIFITILNIIFLKIEIIRKDESNHLYGAMLFVFLVIWISKSTTTISMEGSVSFFWLHFIGLATCLINFFLMIFYKH